MKNLPFLPTIPKLPLSSRITKKPLIYVDYNITPYIIDNPNWVDNGSNQDPDPTGRTRYVYNTELREYAVRCGLIQANICYDHMLNYTSAWADRVTGDYLPLPYDGIYYHWLPDQPTGGWSLPTDAVAVKAYCKLIRDAQHFSAEMPSYSPVWTDLGENSQLYTPDWFRRVSPAEAVQVAQRWLDSAMLFRQYGNLYRDVEFHTYGGNLWSNLFYLEEDRFLGDQTTKNLVDKFREIEFYHSSLYTGYTASVYNDDKSAETDNLWWYSEVKRHQGIYNQYYRHLSRKTLFITPFWQCYDPKYARLNNTPLPISKFTKQVNYGVHEGWDLFCWIGDMSDMSVKPHIDFLTRWIT